MKLILTHVVLITLLAGYLAHSATAQQTDTMEVVLPAIEIEATRATTTSETAPFAVTMFQRPAATRALEPGLSLDDVLRTLPGVWINDRGHDALGERLIIRGMGWRAGFGVRGVQVLLDGIPLTMPDGQAILDVVDPAFIRQADLVRGPAAVFWGNASGGVLALSTASFRDTASVRLRAMGGSFGTRQAAGEVTLPAGRHRFHAYASSIHRDGFRAYSTGGFTRAGLHGNLALGPRSQLRTMAALAVQDVEHPGSLTLDQVQDDPRQADERYVNTQSGKESTQLQVGATLDHQTRLGILSATAYGLIRRLDNPLPFAYIDLNRTAGGARLQLQQHHERVGYTIGVDAGWQRDDRLNLDNDSGRPGTERDLDQIETVRTAGAFAVGSYRFTSRLGIHAGLRVDGFRFAMDDRLPANGDQSGDRTFGAWSPSAGLTYRMGSTLLFANYSTAFETPTTTELVNRPDADGGFNPMLDPQRTHGFEAGFRGISPAARLHVDAALFYLSVRDRLLPFQSDDGRTYYVNAGENTHQGLELSLAWQALSHTDVQVTYTGNRYVFNDAELEDRYIPGVPSHHVFASVRTTQRGIRAEVTLETASHVFADNKNETRAEGYAVVDLYTGHTGLRVGRVVTQPFLKLGNVFDVAYVGSLVVNAQGGRYFEPSPGRTIQAGLNLSY